MRRLYIGLGLAAAVAAGIYYFLYVWWMHCCAPPPVICCAHVVPSPSPPSASDTDHDPHLPRLIGGLSEPAKDPHPASGSER